MPLISDSRTPVRQSGLRTPVNKHLMNEPDEPFVQALEPLWMSGHSKRCKGEASNRRRPRHHPSGFNQLQHACQQQFLNSPPALNPHSRMMNC
jgi:hypothetical protein